ncbi:MAG: hypothetical protein QM627_11385 [Luteolibacter sp.]
MLESVVNLFSVGCKKSLFIACVGKIRHSVYRPYMATIPADTLKAILNLRAENGLEADEASVYRDLETVKWTLNETPRYRRAGRSPVYLSGKYLTANGVDPVTGEKESNGPAKKAKAAASAKSSPKYESKLDESAFYRVLHAKGFSIKVSQDLITGAVETQLPESIKRLGLQFDEIPGNATGVYVTQTSPQIQVAMSLDKFLEIAGIRP